MNSFAIAAIVFACVFGGALIGLQLRAHLPGHHLREDSKDIVKLGIGVIATMTALVLGLLVSSAKTAFDKTSNELTQTAATVIELDRVLAHYGPEAGEIRTRFRQNFQTMTDLLFSEDRSKLAKLNAPASHLRLETLDAALRDLVPRNEVQRELRARALALESELVATRWLLVLQAKETISMPLLVIVATWLMLCALSVAGAIFLILEMDHPLEGVVRISDAPLRAALGYLGQ